MFDGCSSLIELDLSNFKINTNKLTMIGTFKNCSSLTELNMPWYDINKIINMEYIFKGCSNELKKK